MLRACIWTLACSGRTRRSSRLSRRLPPSPRNQFWDGRAASLEEQAKGPITNPIEMGMPDHDTAIDRIRSIPGYRPYFEAAFGSGDTINIDNAAKAIAAYESTLITPNSPYDRYVKGDKEALLADYELLDDVGRFEQTGDTGDKYVWRVPTMPHLPPTPGDLLD